MNRPVAAVFALLVAATFAAFFVAQRLKNSPSVVQQLTFRGFLSPNGDGRFDTLRVQFKLKEADDVTVTVIDDDGDEVRTILDDRHIEAYSPFAESLRWDGRDAAGRIAPDGRYRLRISLRAQGRSIVPPRSVLLDTTPPRPVVRSMGPDEGLGPELLPKPGGGAAVARFDAAQRRALVRLFKTGPGRARQVLVAPLRQGATSWSWDGRVGGARASAGTYLVVVEWRDLAGNIGTSVPLDRRGLPRLPRGQRLPGRGGITVRYLGAQTAGEPVKAREDLTVCVDARQRPYTWTLRRLGQPRPVKRGGRSTRPCVTARAPGGISGVYLFEVRTRRHHTAVPVAVQARRPRAGTRARPRGVLVVLPYETWQGRNPADDDGDGAPNVLDRGVSAGLSRVLATRGGLPRDFARREALVLGWLDRTGRRYDLTTDLALERGTGPKLEGHQGVLIPGDARWLTPGVRRGLRAFARRGGTVASLGTDSLRRSVAISRSGRALVDPRPAGRGDLFGARLAPVRPGPVTLEVSPLEDEIGLFEGTNGSFPDLGAWEETVSLGEEADHAASAVTVQPPGKTVIVAARFGRGLVIRPGLVEFAAGLTSTPDPAIETLMARTWTLLSR